MISTAYNCPDRSGHSESFRRCSVEEGSTYVAVSVGPARGISECGVEENTTVINEARVWGLLADEVVE